MERVLAGGGAGAFGIANNRATSNGRNVQALKVKAPATPNAPISAAANMGPHSLAILNCTEFSARAGLSSARGTRLGTTERKTGPLRAQTIPSRNVKVMTTQGVARPRNADTARPAPRAHANPCKVINQTFRDRKSEITPASRASKSTGQKSANCKISTSRPWWGLPIVRSEEHTSELQ